MKVISVAFAEIKILTHGAEVFTTHKIMVKYTFTNTAGFRDGTLGSIINLEWDLKFAPFKIGIKLIPSIKQELSY